MKTKALFFFLLLTGLYTFLANAQEPVTPGPHGGVVKSTEGYCIEMSGRVGLLSAFLLDPSWNPIDNSNMACEVRYLLSDGSEITHKLVPLGKEGFRTEEPMGNFVSCLITFELRSREVSVRFNNDQPLLGSR
jgi:hypothetical protein